MTFEQFKYYLDAYGASLDHWPADARQAAERFLASHREAAAARAEAQRLDALLDRYLVVPDELASRRLGERIARRAALLEQERPARGGETAWLWSRAAVLAVVALLGVVTGTYQLNAQSQAVSSGPAWSDTAQLTTDDAPFEVAGL